MAEKELGDGHYRAVVPEDNLHTVSLYEDRLCVRCRRCDHRASLGADVLPIWPGTMKPAHSLRVKCSRCGGSDLQLLLPVSPQAVEDFRDAGS